MVNYGASPAIQHLCLLVAFILDLVATLSVSVTKSIYLMKASIKVGVSFLSVQDSITFGVWGLCFGGASADLFGLEKNASGDCTKPKLGYSTQYSSNKDVKNLVHGSIGKALIMHPLGTAFTFACLVLSLINHFRSTRRNPKDTSSVSSTATPRRKWTATRILHILEITFNVLASLFTGLAFTIDLAVAGKAKDAANKTDGAVHVSYGNGMWLTLVAWIMIWIAKLTKCGVAYRARRRRARENKY